MAVFEAVGVPGMIDELMRVAPPQSRIVVVGVCMQPDALTPMFGIAKELNLQFVLGYTPEEFAASLHSIAEGAIDVAPMITGEVGLDEVPAAFDALANPEEHCKILVVPGGTLSDRGAEGIIGARGRAARAGPAGGGAARPARGRRDEGRAARVRRPGAVAADLDERPAQRLLHGLQPGQAQHHDRRPHAGRARRVPAPRRAGRRRDHELQAGHDGRVGPRLRGARRPQPAPRVRHRVGVRSDRPRRRARGRRPVGAGRRRPDQRHRHRRRRADDGRRHDRRPHLVAEPRQRRARRAAGPPAHRARPARRRVAARQPDLGPGERVHVLPVVGRAARPAQPRPPDDRRAVRHHADRRRVDRHRRRRRRRTEPIVLRRRSAGPT